MRDLFFNVHILHQKISKNVKYYVGITAHKYIDTISIILDWVLLQINYFNPLGLHMSQREFKIFIWYKYDPMLMCYLINGIL